MEPTPRRNHEKAKPSAKRASRCPGILISHEIEARYAGRSEPKEAHEARRHEEVNRMTTLTNYPCWGIPREELHEARRRAQAERTKVLREILAAVVWRRREAAELPVVLEHA